MKDEKAYIKHIVVSIEEIFTFLNGCSKEGFLDNRMVQLAVVRNLQTLSDACGHLGVLIQNKYSNIPWRKIRGLRNILVHDYLGKTDLDIVWSVVHNNLRELKETLIKEL